MGPLKGITILEFAGLGPAPFCGMLLADLGAEVIRIDRKPRSAQGEGLATVTARNKGDVLSRGRRSIVLDLKRPGAKEIALQLIERSDALIEGFRPGVMEGLDLGPDVCQQRNPRLVYGRVTGWGQDGPLANAAGHDINYIALTGVLHSIARQGCTPTPPPGLVGDFGGGGMLLAFGLVSALLEASKSGKGQVIDASVCDGSALLAALLYGWKAQGMWNAEAGTNMGDSGAHFYDAYRCSDGRCISIGAIEPQFYKLLLQRCQISDPAFDKQWKQSEWPVLKEKLSTLIATRTRDEWCQLLEGTDACFAPVLDLDEAPRHPHNVARGTFVEVDGVIQPAPAPRFSRSTVQTYHSVDQEGAQTRAILGELGFAAEAIADLLAQQVAWAPSACS
ncbi:alpha-methylacyl-CoA racemase [Burkholderia sp. D7]|nr:alpha-methylacyl-CoA racemase [Burkholderia sp. D7]